MNSNTIIYSTSYNPMHYASSLPPLPSNDNIQHQHYYCYSVPPPKFHVPVQSIQQHYYENYHRQIQYNSHLHQYRYYEHDQRDLILKGSTIPYKTRKSKSTDITDNHHKQMMSTYTKIKPIPILKGMKSAVNWVLHTFCFCVTDDTLSLIEFNDTFKTTEKVT